MSEVLRGNFATKRKVDPESKAPSLEEQFEREALKRLGGSIAFVSRKKLLWTGEARSDTESSRD